MRVLVTGGAGYIGSVVTSYLAKAGHRVVVLDDLSQGHADAVIAGATLVRADLRDRATLVRTLTEHGIESVVHLAGRSIVSESMEQPAAYYASNLVGSLVLLDALRECDVRSLVFSSTAAVYGRPARDLVDEDAPVAPTNPYGETKLAIERAIEWHSRAYGLSAVSLRYFNAAGATETLGERHDPETHLLPRVLDAAAGVHDAIEIFGTDYPTPDGTCIRDYVSVRDLAAAHSLALDHVVATRERPQARAFNVGAGVGRSVREVVEAAEAVTGASIPIRTLPRREGDPPRLVADTSRIEKELGWTARESDLRSIVESVWRWRSRRT